MPFLSFDIFCKFYRDCSWPLNGYKVTRKVCRYYANVYMLLACHEDWKMTAEEFGNSEREARKALKGKIGFYELDILKKIYLGNHVSLEWDIFDPMKLKHYAVFMAVIRNHKCFEDIKKHSNCHWDPFYQFCLDIHFARENDIAVGSSYLLLSFVGFTYEMHNFAIILGKDILFYDKFTEDLHPVISDVISSGLLSIAIRENRINMARFFLQKRIEFHKKTEGSKWIGKLFRDLYQEFSNQPGLPVDPLITCDLMNHFYYEKYRTRWQKSIRPRKMDPMMIRELFSWDPQGSTICLEKFLSSICETSEMSRLFGIYKDILIRKLFPREILVHMHQKKLINDTGLRDYLLFFERLREFPGDVTFIHSS